MTTKKISRARKREIRELAREYIAQLVAQEETGSPRFGGLTEEELDLVSAEFDAISERIFPGQTGLSE